MNADQFPYFHPGQAKVINGRIQRPRLDGYDIQSLLKEVIDRVRFKESDLQYVDHSIMNCVRELIDEEFNRRYPLT